MPGDSTHLIPEDAPDQGALCNKLFCAQVLDLKAETLCNYKVEDRVENDLTEFVEHRFQNNLPSLGQLCIVALELNEVDEVGILYERADYACRTEKYEACKLEQRRHIYDSAFDLARSQLLFRFGTVRKHTG